MALVNKKYNGIFLVYSRLTQVTLTERLSKELISSHWFSVSAVGPMICHEFVTSAQEMILVSD